MVLQRDRRTEHRHDAVAGELVHRAAVALDDNGRAVDQLGHDLAQPLRADRRRDVHRMHHIGEQHRHLLVLRVCVGHRPQASRSRGRTCRRLAVQLRKTRTPCRLRSCHRREYWLAAVMSIAHVNIVSPLASQHVPYHRCDPARG